jgi:hypothetical protein
MNESRLEPSLNRRLPMYRSGFEFIGSFGNHCSPAVDGLWVGRCHWWLWDHSLAFRRSCECTQDLLAGLFLRRVSLRPRVFGRTVIDTELVTIFVREDCELKRWHVARRSTRRAVGERLTACDAEDLT